MSLCGWLPLQVGNSGVVRFLSARRNQAIRRSVPWSSVALLPCRVDDYLMSANGDKGESRRMATFRDVSERRHKPQTTSDGTLRKISDSPPKDVNTEGLPGSAFSGGAGLLAVTAALPKFERPAINLQAVYFLLFVPLVPPVKGQRACSPGRCSHRVAEAGSRTLLPRLC